MLELYHNAISTCSQKVRLTLAEKGLAFKSHEIDLIGGGQHDPEYVKLNPNHVVPTLVDDGNVLLESTLINEYLDERYPAVAMRPIDAVGRHRVRLWARRVDDKVHPAIAVLTFAMGPRVLLLQQPEEVRNANIEAIPGPRSREQRRSVIEHGVHAPEFVGALGELVRLLDDMEVALGSGGPWLAGANYGLLESTVLPYVLRLDHLGLTSLLDSKTRPALADWYRRATARESFAVAVTGWAPPEIVDLLRQLGAPLVPEVEAMLAS